jgi:hypothetical protein
VHGDQATARVPEHIGRPIQAYEAVVRR